MSDLETGAASAVTESEVVTQDQTTTEAPQESAPPDLDSELSAIYDKNNQPRSEDGKFTGKVEEQPAQAEEPVSEGTPENDTVETAQQPSIQPPNSLPSELKAQWSSVPPSMQEYIAKREAESHRAITQLGQQAKAFEPFGRLVESNKDVFQNHRRNVAPVDGISQLLEAQRQLDRDPVASIAHIAKVYGVDLSIFGNQSQEASNQSPQVASLQAYIRDLEAKVSNIERFTIAEQQQKAEAQQTALLNTVEKYLAENPIDDELMPEVAAQIEVLNRTAPHLSEVEKMRQAHERALWSNPSKRETLIAKERAEQEAKRAKEQAKAASEAKRASNINVRSTPGTGKNVRTLDDELSAIYDKARSA